MIKNCVICGEAFEAKTRALACRKLICLSKHRVARQKRYEKKLRDQEPERIRKSQRDLSRKRYWRDPEKQRARLREKRRENPERQKAYDKTWRAKNQQARRNLEIAKLICSA